MCRIWWWRDKIFQNKNIHSDGREKEKNWKISSTTETRTIKKIHSLDLQALNIHVYRYSPRFILPILFSELGKTAFSGDLKYLRFQTDRICTDQFEISEIVVARLRKPANLILVVWEIVELNCLPRQPWQGLCNIHLYSEFFSTTCN